MRPSAKQLINREKLIIVEIGVYRGGNALTLLENLDVELIYLIDPYRPFNEVDSTPRNWKEMLNAKQIAHKALEPFKEKCVWIEESSKKAFSVIPDSDYIYIDGSHEYVNVKNDFLMYKHKVLPGGIIGGHDYPNKPGVKKAVDEIAGDLTVKTKKPDWWVEL